MTILALLYFLYLFFLGSCSDEKTADSKRLLANDPEFVLRELNNIKSKITTLENTNAGLQSKITTLENTNVVLQSAVSKVQSSGEHGSTYTRWGKKTCTGNSTELVYTGFVGSSWYTSTGSGSSYLCLPTDPTWGNYSDTVDVARGRIYGTEYEGLQFNPTIQNEDAPCAVCRSGVASTVLMIPGRNKCYPGWKMEYYGYLVSNQYQNARPKEYICLDSNPDVLLAGHDNKNGGGFFSVEGMCGSLPCLPYVNGRELTCVVCSK